MRIVKRTAWWRSKLFKKFAIAVGGVIGVIVAGSAFMKAYLPVIIVVIAIIVVVVLVLFVPVVRHWIERHKTVLDCLSIVGVIGLVLSLSVTVSQFNSVQQEHKKEQETAFHSRMKTRQSELEVNAQICNKEFLDPNAEYIHDGISFQD